MCGGEARGVARRHLVRRLRRWLQPGRVRPGVVHELRPWALHCIDGLDDLLCMVRDNVAFSRSPCLSYPPPLLSLFFLPFAMPWRYAQVCFNRPPISSTAFSRRLPLRSMSHRCVLVLRESTKPAIRHTNVWIAPQESTGT